MNRYTVGLVCEQIVRLLNSAFYWTETDQTAVASVTKPNKFEININGQEFEVTIKEVKNE